MKARLILIAILFFAALHMSSCFLKPKRHFNDHRGVYKDKGVTKDQLVYLEERKQRMHPRKYHRKSVKQHKREDREIDRELAKSNANKPVIDTSIHSLGLQSTPTVQPAVQDTVKKITPDVQATPAATPTIGPDMNMPADQPAQPDPAAKKVKKKHKKTKPTDSQKQ